MAVRDGDTLDLVDLGSTPRDFIDLLKPRVMSLVVFTAFAGIILAPGQLHPILAAVSLLAIALGAGASGALNMGLDSDIDRLMKRTALRPIPSGRIDRETALGFGTVLASGSVILLAFSSNWTAAALLALTICFYVVVYTVWLKRRTPQNIVIGGAAGALPPVVGWAAVTGSVSLEPIIMFAIIFLWTPAHFWALAILKRDEYAAAGVPMLPSVASRETTTLNILVYAVLTAVSGVLPTVFGFAGLGYALVAAALGAWLVQRAVLLRRAGPEDERRHAGRLFGVSIVYLFALFGAMMADGVIAGLVA
ncbi:protoheme IX farnesyltransferase [Acuticoccus sediminis]|uniref:Protoheme IX farnesyltransferase n=1 Tax=Acuticoccus sediminis TaxID=2184697 RepID=A0A8B2NS92_9HYPH|nr:heme o synthase [Acuticoccus sediminis]RAI03097.1 protoheme IX farnesyltransferase [Acuticoccus sediminis]